MATSSPATQRHGDRWTVRLFGGLQLLNGSHHLDRWPPTALTRLLLRLLLDPAPQPRDELAQWLWPTIRPRKGRGSDDARALRRTRLQGLLTQKRLGQDDRALAPKDSPPPPVGRFFGRQQELAALQSLLRAERLVAITGPGGCGKSRLAHQALADASGYGTLAFVALAPHEGSERLLDHVRDTLQIQPAAQPALKQIVTRLSGQQALLVLDNFEAFADRAGEQALLAVLDALPQLQLLLTTTRALHTPRCHTLRLEPLAVPHRDADLRSASDDPAVALFVERAQAVRPGFKLTARNRAVVIDVCRATDGLPLAIELAALRVRQVPPGEMAQALQRSHKLLSRVDPGARRQLRLQQDAAGGLDLVRRGSGCRGVAVVAQGCPADLRG